MVPISTGLESPPNLRFPDPPEKGAADGCVCCLPAPTAASSLLILSMALGGRGGDSQSLYISLESGPCLDVEYSGIS